MHIRARAAVLLLTLWFFFPGVHALTKSNSCMSLSVPDITAEAASFEIQATNLASTTDLVFQCDMLSTSGVTLQRSLLWNIAPGEVAKFKFTSPFDETHPSVYFNCSKFNLLSNPAIKSYSCRLDTTDRPATAITPVAGKAPLPPSPLTNRVSYSNRGLYVDGSPAFFSGVNFANWHQQLNPNIRDNHTAVDMELQKMDDAGVNMLRVFVDKDYFSPNLYTLPLQPFETYPQGYQDSLTYLIKKASDHDIMIELVPSGYWANSVKAYYSDHWWTEPPFIDFEKNYYYEFGRYLYSHGFDNIAYISMMQEGSGCFDWFDPLSAPRRGFSYPGPAGISSAQLDWQSWLSFRGKPTSTPMDFAHRFEYAAWVNNRFADLVQLRTDAFKAGSQNAYPVGAEGGGGVTGGAFRYDIQDTVCWTTLTPDFWAHAVDVAEIHDYDAYSELNNPPCGTGVCTYQSGFRAYDTVLQAFNKPTFYGELNYDQHPLFTNAAVAWPKISQKMDFIKTTPSVGFSIWAWNDYGNSGVCSGTDCFGFENNDLSPRPILDNFRDWNYANLARPVNIPLQAGLNFVSVPVRLKLSDPSSLIPSSTNPRIDGVWNYENGVWKVYRPGLAALSNLNKFEPQKSYFVSATAPATLALSGLNRFYKNSRRINAVALGQWTTLGLLGSSPAPLPGVTVAAVAEFWTFQNGANLQLDPLSDSLQPLKGYWIQAN